MYTYTPLILAFAGSARRDSFNRHLVRIAARGAEQAGAHVTLIDLKEYSLPLYDADLEAADGIPQTVRALQQLLRRHDGFLIASPEYNASVPALLKNLIDWTSRPDGSTANPYRNKLAVLMSASPGSYGGAQALDHLRSILQSIGTIVLPDRLMIGRARDMFFTDGSMTEAPLQQAVERLGNTLAVTLQALDRRLLENDPYNRRNDMARL